MDVELLRNCSKISKFTYIHYGSSNYVHKDVRLADCSTYKQSYCKLSLSTQGLLFLLVPGGHNLARS